MKAILIGINKNLAGVQKGGDLQNRQRHNAGATDW